MFSPQRKIMFSKIFRPTPFLKNVFLAAFGLSLSSFYQNRLKNVLLPHFFILPYAKSPIRKTVV